MNIVAVIVLLIATAWCTAALYIDIVNLFVRILSIMGRRRNA